MLMYARRTVRPLLLVAPLVPRIAVIVSRYLRIRVSVSTHFPIMVAYTISVG